MDLQDVAMRTRLSDGERRGSGSDTGVLQSVRKNCRIEGDYEVEVSASKARIPVWLHIGYYKL